MTTKNNNEMVSVNVNYKVHQAVFRCVVAFFGVTAKRAREMVHKELKANGMRDDSVFIVGQSDNMLIYTIYETMKESVELARVYTTKHRLVHMQSGNAFEVKLGEGRGQRSVFVPVDAETGEHLEDNKT